MTTIPTSASRLARARAAMAAKNLPAMLITRRENVSWLSGFTGSNGFVLLTADQALFATDSRYITQAAAQCPGFQIELLATSAPEEIAQVLQKAGVPRIGFEASHLTVRLHQVYQEKLGEAVQLVATDRLIDDLRLIKETEEIARIEEACQIALRTWEYVLPLLRPGAVEWDVMLELEWFIRKECRAEVAFETIVASGPRSALPHGRAADRVMQHGDFVTLDFGARVDGYHSDITRTVVLGEPSAKQCEVYQIVHDALYKAIDAIRPGVAGKEVDAVARDYIKDAGFGDYFGHGLGHSLGLACHDGPGLAPRSDITLASGMVLTVEPGIYIPDWGGVRIEHDVLVTETGARILTPSPTELLAL